MKTEKEQSPGQEEKNSRADKQKKRSRHSSAANLDSIIRSATDAARSHRHSDSLGNTGTNISYEGPTAPGAGGSVGTGQASGQDAVGARIHTDDALDHVSSRKHMGNNADEELEKPEQDNDDPERDR